MNLDVCVTKKLIDQEAMPSLVDLPDEAIEDKECRAIFAMGRDYYVKNGEPIPREVLEKEWPRFFRENGWGDDGVSAEYVVEKLSQAHVVKNVLRMIEPPLMRVQEDPVGALRDLEKVIQSVRIGEDDRGREDQEGLAPIDSAIADGYIKDYVRWASGQVMAPPEFHLAVAVTQMSVLLGNRVHFRLGGRTHPANLYLCLLGRAGQAKKSSAITLGTSLLDAATDGALRLPEESSREALLQTLSERPAGYLEQTELMSFLERCRLTYMQGAREDMCTLFDAPAVYRRRLKKEGIEIRNASLTVIGAAVIDALADWTKGRDLATGFMSRFLFLPQTSSVGYIGMEPPEIKGKSDWVTELRERSKLVPEPQTMFDPPKVISFSPKAKRRWESYDRSMQTREVPAELSGFYGRLGLYAAKLALCYALAAKRLEPEPEDVEHGIAFVEYARTNTVRLVREEFALSQEGKDLNRVYRIIKAAGEIGLDHSTALKRSHMKQRPFREAIDTLAEAERIELRKVVTPGRTKTVYVAKG